VLQSKCQRGSQSINNATNPSDDKSESVLESAEESDFKPSFVDDIGLIQPAK